MRVTAVVVSWNSAEDLGDCVASLLAQDHGPLDVVVVDNASTDDTLRVLASLGEGVTVVRNATNRGFAGAVNQAVRDTDAEAILTVNPDVVAAPDLVRRLVAALGADPSRGSIQPKLVRPVPTSTGQRVIDTTGHVAFRTRLFRNRGEGQPDDGRWDVPGEVFGVSGACALYRCAMLDEVAVPGAEPFDESLFAFFEDVDLDWRARRRGWVAWYEPSAVAVHERGGAGPRRTAFVERLNYRNRLLVIAANDDVRRLISAAPSVLATTALKTLELLLTSPAALLLALVDLVRSWPRVRTARAHRDAVATVPSEDVVGDWFGTFDYAHWVATWWDRVRGRTPGHAP